MSDGYIFDSALPEDHPVHAKMNKRLKGALVVLAIILAGELIWVLGITPCMPLAVIDISGIPELDRGTVLAQAGIGIHSSYMTVDIRGAELSLGALYQVESARVTRQFPDTVKIALEPRKAVAMALAPVNGLIEPVFFDRFGVVFKIGIDGDKPLERLPIISGLVFENPSLGMKLPSVFQKFLSDLARLNNSDPELLGTLSEIQVNRRPYDGFDLVLYPVHYPVKIRVGNELTQETLRYMLLLIDVFIKQGVAVDEIDFRTGTASYIRKEASLG
ncbi:putative cell division protein FtsQ [Treponema primitia ZAS-2]|uniref:Putative cell division protein FtsQ n=1 Tax=Treponema primitia (strain ATCC BAA-887 / DSM 12427 / ZAS-2) TaxID=545694 RepID=F5YGK7_TREPZ|nr:FtsQ-type POTRA domain-containing protein [Treponema primitia]AEF83606.1 putative cell division protein FtsQ [Treponema primitia ZAS-2]